MRSNRRTWYKTIGVLMVLMLVAAACGGDDSEPPEASAPDETTAPPGEDGGIQTDGFESLGDVTLTVLAEENDEATLALAKEQFEAKYPNVTVEITLRAFDDYMQIAPNIMAGDDPPDVAQGNMGYTIDGLLVAGGLILPFDDYSEVYGWEDAFGSALDVYRFDDTGTDFGKGTLWGVSAAAEFVGVYYNKEKFAAIGGELPETFEEFEALLAAAKAAGELPIQLGNGEGWPALHVYGMVQAAYRPASEIRDWIFGEPGSTVVTDTELQAAEALVAWKDAGYFPDGLNGIGYDDSVAAYTNGEGVFLIAGNWNTATLEENMGDNVGYFAMPVGPSGVLGGTASLALPWHVSSKSENPDLGAAFIALMMDVDFADDLAAVGRVPAQESTVEISGLLAEVAAGAAEVIASDGITLYADWTTDTMFNTLTAATQELLGGQISAEEFLADIQADWDTFFAG